MEEKHKHEGSKDKERNQSRRKLQRRRGLINNINARSADGKMIPRPCY